MATQAQAKYIEDLAVLKTKEFKELKELIFANAIVEKENGIVANAVTIAEITNALTDLQASRLIEVLVQMKQPARANSYAPGRVRRTIAALDDIKATIDDWGF